ncbi:GyrI-like small molecule binding domain-containing protein [Rhizobiales bacterium GAS188]|nr:GyrI-like small molecule binding domain-containing protein [Rhizobiales bacterium GAS188]
MGNLSKSSSSLLRIAISGLALLAVSGLCVLTVAAQTAPKPGPVDSAPLPPPGGSAPVAQSPSPSAPQPAPEAQGTPPTPTPVPAAPAAPPQQSADAANATLGPAPADPGTPDDLTIAPKPEAYIVGEASWDDALPTIRNAQKKVKDALDKAGVKIGGRPLTRFVKTGDEKFSYEIGYPIEPPTSQPSLPPEVKLGTTPSGSAVRFTHHGSYDDIDGTYEAITVDLDAKGIEVNDAFLEEYLNDIADSSDANLEVYIYVFKK